MATLMPGPLRITGPWSRCPAQAVTRCQAISAQIRVIPHAMSQYATL